MLHINPSTRNTLAKAIDLYRNNQISFDNCIACLEFFEEKYELTLIGSGFDYLYDPSLCAEVLVCQQKLIKPASSSDIERLVSKFLYPFWNETEALLLAFWPYDSAVLFDGDTFVDGSDRYFAQLVCSWANQNPWAGYSKWNYMDFYYGQSFAGTGFEVFIRTLYSLVEKRDRLLTSS